jgi:Na+(H+)/acetate symporter ActP
VLGGILANGQNVAFLVALAFAVAASANLPTLLYSLSWRKFNTTGALRSIYGGLGISIVLISFSPAVSGKVTAGRSASMLPLGEVPAAREHCSVPGRGTVLTSAKRTLWSDGDHA